MNDADFVVIDLDTHLGVQMFAFVWVSCAASGVSLSLWMLDYCCSRRHRRQTLKRPRE